MTIVTTDPLQADGTNPAKPGAKPDADVQPLLQAAFAMEREGQPQIAGLPGGVRAAIFEVGRITPAAPAPLAEIRSTVAADWTRRQASDAASAAADKVLAAMNKKQPMEAAAKLAGTALPPINPLNTTREALAAMQPRVPAPLALLFSMAKGTTRKIAAPNEGGWLIVELDQVVPGQVAPNDPLIQQASSELGKTTGREYEEQLRSAIAREIGSTRSGTAIRTVRTNLVGAQ